MGFKVAVTDQKRDPGVMVESSIKMLAYCVALLRGVNYMLEIIKKRTENQTTKIKIYGKVTLGGLCSVLVTTSEKEYCRVLKCSERGRQNDHGAGTTLLLGTQGAKYATYYR